MCALYNKFWENGIKQDQKALELLMRSSNIDELSAQVTSQLNSSNFKETWNYLLLSFRETSECHLNRKKLILSVLRALENNQTCVSTLSNVVNRICLEITKLRPEDLVELCTFCLGCIQSERVTKMSWKDLLPELLNVIMGKDMFEIDGIQYTGLEYKTEFLNTICMAQLSPEILTPLASVFVDIPMNKEEHVKVVNKLASYLERLMPQEIPPFIFQILKLCKNSNARSVFIRLENYFQSRIYQQINEFSPESIDLDAIECARNQEMIEAESTVLYHIYTSASLGYECIKDYLNSLKMLIKAPEFILRPFQLMILFSISAIHLYEETVFDIIRPCIVRCFTEDQRKMRSCWFKEMVPTTVKPKEVFSTVILSSQGRELVLQSLVNFAFVLLGIGSALGRDPIAEKQWNLANVIILKILKRKRDIAPTILENLTNNILKRHHSSQYIECLSILSKNLPLLMLENQSSVVELINGLMQIPGPNGNQLLDAILTLTKVSSTLRDHLIIILRKALYTRFTETRHVAILGLLKLIRQLKLSNVSSLSLSNSSFSSGHSIFTQISLSKTTQTFSTSTFSSEALCLEVLNILKRCFMQQCDTKLRLYEGLYNSVYVNPGISLPALDVIWFHFIEFYIMDEDVLPPLNFKKITTLKDLDSDLVEPISKLIYTIGIIITEAYKIMEYRENTTLNKFINVFDSLCERMQDCELVHFELDDGTNLLDILPECQQKVLILKEALGVYEALIAYKIYSWDKESKNQAKVINSLFQGYNRLLHFTKTLSKPKKADTKRKKKGTDGTTQLSQTKNTVRKEGVNQIKIFTIPESILDFQVIEKAQNVLYESNLMWTTVTEANILRTKREFHQYIMQTTLSVIQNIKQNKDVDDRVKEYYYKFILNTSIIIFKKIIKRLNEFVDFDCLTAILALGCFQSILTLIKSNFLNKLELFLKKVVSENEEEGLVACITIIFDVYKKLFDLDIEICEDPEIKKMSVVVINTINLLTEFIPNGTNTLSMQVYDWLKDHAYNHIIPPRVTGTFINLFFDCHLKYKISLTLLEQISISIGDEIGVLTEEDHKQEEFKIINETSAQNIVVSLCCCLKSILEDVDAVISRLRSEYHILTFPAIEDYERKHEKLKSKEQGVCLHLCFIVTILTNLSNIVVSPGSTSETIFKCAMLCFGTLEQLTKYFTSRSTKVNLVFQGARFDRLVKLAGKQLAPAVYKFILHIEDSQKQDAVPNTNKKKQRNVDAVVLKSKILRETRLIPKVVYEIEQFGKSVILLSNKTKVDLAKHVGQGITRDFRILQLKEILQVEENMVDDSLSTQNTGIENNLEDQTDTIDTDNDESQECENIPPTKKVRK